VGGGYAQNLKTVGEYGAAIQEGRFAVCRGLVASDEDVLRRDLILRLMCQFRLDKRDVERRYGIEDFDRRFAAELAQLAPMADDGLVEIDRDRIEVAPLGRLLVRNIAMSFDAYLGTSTVRYSRTV
jgi:oxygen-independent coproporphyrinogen-3 oxidase